MNLHFSNENIFTFDHVFNKQNDRVVTFENDISEHRRVSRTNHPAIAIMLSAVALNVEKFWRPMGQEEHLRIRPRLPTEQSSGPRGKDCTGVVGNQHKRLTSNSHQIWTPLTSACWRKWGRALQDTRQQHRWTQSFY